MFYRVKVLFLCLIVAYNVVRRPLLLWSCGSPFSASLLRTMWLDDTLGITFDYISNTYTSTLHYWASITSYVSLHLFYSRFYFLSHTHSIFIFLSTMSGLHTTSIDYQLYYLDYLIYMFYHIYILFTLTN